MQSTRMLPREGTLTARRALSLFTNAKASQDITASKALLAPSYALLHPATQWPNHPFSYKRRLFHGVFGPIKSPIQQLEEIDEGSNRSLLHTASSSGRRRRLFVANLTYEVTRQDLKDHVETCGARVEHVNIYQRPDGKSKGCGHVQFATADDAKKALLLQDTWLMGRQIFVREDRAEEDDETSTNLSSEDGALKKSSIKRFENKFKGGNRPAVRPPHNSSGEQDSVYVANLPFEATWQDLKDYIEASCGAGTVKNCNIFKRPDGKSKGSGIVKFATTDDARMALKLKDTDFMGRPILMREDSRDHVLPRNSSRECRVFLSNLPYDVTRQDLTDHMETCGAKVKHVTIFNRPDGKSKGSGIVEFGTRDDTRMALKLNRRELMGRQIFVRADREEGRDSRDFKSEDERLEQMLNELEAKI